MNLIGPSAAPWSSSGTGPGVLALHGFSGNPTAMRPLADRLASEGYPVEVPLLPGHGTSWRDLAGTTWPDWLAEATAAFDRLGPPPHAIVGLSMGGTLALRLAQVRGDDVAALVLINPLATFKHPLTPALGLLKRIIPSVPGIGNDIAKRGADELPYDRVPLRAVASMIDLVNVVRTQLHTVAAPTLALTSRTDHTVRPTDSAVVLNHITASPREQVWLEHSFHVATLDYDAQLVADRTVGWLADTIGTDVNRDHSAS